MNILIVDDDNIFRKHIAKALVRRGYNVDSAVNGEDALCIAEDKVCDIAFIDMKMPDMSGIEVTRKLKEIQPALKSIILTGYGSIATAVEAMKIGACNYLTKPCSIDEIENIIRIESLKGMETGTHEDPSGLYHGIAGKSRGIQDIIAAIKMVKDYSYPVLICGESGTGKELIARAIHFDSIRKDKPFIAINCASLKPELLENELFGHVKGAFTGATDSKDGLLKVADGGTVFIDEIGDMHLTIQASLLRFLETGIFRPLGSTKEVKVNVRIVAAINKTIEDEVKNKRFRHDLYYRLNVCRINVPPLRDRKEDIPILVRHFLRTSPLAREMDIAFSNGAVDLLKTYHWHGNVRELFNTFSRTILFSQEKVITTGLIKSVLAVKSESSSLPVSSLDDAEKRHLLESLKANNWNISRTANILCIDRRTLQRKINRYQLR